LQLIHGPNVGRSVFSGQVQEEKTQVIVVPALVSLSQGTIADVIVGQLTLSTQ
jgi:hypothetical protein